MKSIHETSKVVITLILLIGIGACHNSSRSNPSPPLPTLSTDATLSALTLSADNIAPAFASGTTNYTLTTSTDSTTVTPTINQADATITVNGAAATSGAGSTSIPLAVGDTMISIVVTAQDGSTAQTYTVTISRLPALSTDATLAGLTVSAGDVAPAFVSATTLYTLTTLSDSTTVTPTINQADATITVNGAAVTSGAASASIPLAVGDTMISTVVTAEDGSTIQTYSVTISRLPVLSTDASLSGLTASAGDIAPVFASAIANYVLTTLDTSTTLTPTVNQVNATVTVNGIAVLSGAASASVPIDVGNTTINLVVTAEDGSTTQTYTVTIPDDSPVSTVELIDPFPGASDRFGADIFQLANGNIVVSDPGDDTVTPESGAVHLYSPLSSTPIASIFGDRPNSFSGTSFTELDNNNFVITASSSGSSSQTVWLVDANGVQIGATIFADREITITALGNNNFVLAEPHKQIGITISAGRIRLMDGTTGMQIGDTIEGAARNDRLGFDGIVALSNNNYVFTSPSSSPGAILNAGTVWLMDGSTGAQIAILTGADRSDRLGGGGIAAVGTSNYVIMSVRDDTDPDGNPAGSVRLMNGSTGDLISFAGGYSTSFSSVTPLSNNNYVYANGSVGLFNGITGDLIGEVVADQPLDRLGIGGITELGNNNYVITSSDDGEDGTRRAGSVRLVDGSTGMQIGIIRGEEPNDELGHDGITALGNNNYVVASGGDDEGGIRNAGSVRLVSGITGMQIGATLAGEVENAALGRGNNSRSDITALSNNNYVVVLSTDEVGGISNAGSIRLMNGSTAAPIGPLLAGDVEDDHLGTVADHPDSDAVSGFNATIALGNNNYVIPSSFDDEGGIVDAGSVRLVNGNTGVSIGAAIVGAESDAMVSVKVIKPLSGDYFILSQSWADNFGLTDAGMVRLVMP